MQGVVPFANNFGASLIVDGHGIARELSGNLRYLAECPRLDNPIVEILDRFRFLLVRGLAVDESLRRGGNKLVKRRSPMLPHNDLSFAITYFGSSVVVLASEFGCRDNGCVFNGDVFASTYLLPISTDMNSFLTELSAVLVKWGDQDCSKFAESLNKKIAEKSQDMIKMRSLLYDWKVFCDTISNNQDCPGLLFRINELLHRIVVSYDNHAFVSYRPGDMLLFDDRAVFHGRTLNLPPLNEGDIGYNVFSGAGEECRVTLLNQPGVPRMPGVSRYLFDKPFCLS